RGRLDDFIDVPVEVHAGGRARMLRVNVAPTLPNGGFEGDAADNRQADFWLKGLRDFAEPAEGRFCLALPPEGGGEAGAKCPYYAAENTAFLLPRTRYRLELVYRYAGKSQLYAKVIFFDERNKLLGEKLLALPPRWPFAWQEAALAFESPDYAGKAYFRLVNPDRADKGLTGWIDRVRLVESAQP
ncbi:MAG: hypothetical protein GX638_19025, partial [Crenarchaeota archaeon]|nr:hypothetical protein [Thermoproteota archaeon]